MSSFSHAIGVDILTRESDHSLLMWSVALPDLDVLDIGGKEGCETELVDLETMVEFSTR